MVWIQYNPLGSSCIFRFFCFLIYLYYEYLVSDFLIALWLSLVLNVPWAYRGSVSVLRSSAWLVHILFQEVPKDQSEEDMVGRPLPHLAAEMQASGQAVYCDDIPRHENELSLKLVTSTKAHAKITWVLCPKESVRSTLCWKWRWRPLEGSPS